MQVLFDLFSILLFFTTYKLFGGDLILLATAMAMSVSLIQLLFSKFKHNQYNKIQFMSFLSILFLSSATIFLRDEFYIKWKLTVVYWILAGILFTNHLLIRENPIMKILAGNNSDLSDIVWKYLNLNRSLGKFQIIWYHRTTG